MGLCRTVCSSVLVALLSIVLYRVRFGPSISPVWRSSTDPPLPELPPKNTLITDHVTHLFTGKVLGPESFAEDEQKWIYTGLGDGRIIRFKDPNEGFEVFARTGADLPGCGSLEMEPVCGRPLAMQFDAHHNLIVADAYKGLLSINSQGNVSVLLSEVEGAPFMLLNGIVISPTDGTIYFSESSRRWARNQILYESIEGQPTGRLMSLNPRTKVAKVLASGIPFANGICFSSDHGSILVVSTTTASVLRYHLASGKLSTFAENLPGIPDNIVPHPFKPAYLVALGTKRAKPFALLHFLGPYPPLRKLLVKLVPYTALVTLVPKHSMLLELDSNGVIVNSFQDPTGRTPWISEAHVSGDYVYLGSWLNPFLARLPIALLHD